MTLKCLRTAVAALSAGTLAAGCATTQSEPSERPVEVQVVKVPDPQPCPALAALGPEPIYVDTDAAIRAAPSPAARAKLYVLGRAQRITRLAEYAVAKASCEF